jgi:hypothetical protein
VEHGGEQFVQFQDRLTALLPVTPDAIALHRTKLHPLPAWDIDESSITGNAEVIDAMLEELGVKDDPKLQNIVKLIGGDQLSIARLRALQNIRAGHEAGFASYNWGVWIPGLFHAKIADAHGFLVTHWGVPNRASRNPGCLGFHNVCLNRKPIILSSLPPFRVCRDLIFVSLYARVLHCLLLVSNSANLDGYISSLKQRPDNTSGTRSVDDQWVALQRDANEIYTRFVNAERVAELREERCSFSGPEGSTPPGDEIFENACLFLRDALLSRELCDAIKSCDSGRVFLVLKVFAFSYRGSGRTKYAHEMLHLIHNLTHVWPKPLCKIVLNNWILIPSGNPNSGVEVDLMQEHMNFWIKVCSNGRVQHLHYLFEPFQ